MGTHNMMGDNAKTRRIIEKSSFQGINEFSELSKSEVEAKYDACSTVYEKYKEMRQHCGVIIMADTVKKYIGLDDLNLYILDVGCGTGAVGKTLAELGFKNIDALDASSNMLKQAKEKGVFTHFIHTFLEDCTPERVPDASYDLLVAQGLLGPGHIKVDDMDVLWRINKSGGHLLMIGAEDYWQKFPEFHVDLRKKMDAMVAAGKYHLVTETLVDRYCVVEDLCTPARVHLFKKN